MKRIPCFSFLLFFIFFFVINITSIYSQKFTTSSINKENFPILNVNFFAKDSLGNDYNDLTTTNFTITELNQNIDNSKLSIDCKDTIIEPDLNIVLVVDNSGSMEDFDSLTGETRWDEVKAGISKFLDEIDFTSNIHVALVIFDGLSRLKCYFTNNKTSLLDSLNTVTCIGGTNYNPPFLTTDYGAIDLLVHYQELFKSRRVVVFLTDGSPNSSKPVFTDSIINGCNNAKIKVYGITFMMPMNSELNRICSLTEGFSQAGYSKAELINIYEYIASDIQVTKEQSFKLCKLFWEAPPSCSESSIYRNVAIKFTKDDYSEIVNQFYSAPKTSISVPNLSESLIVFDSTSNSKVAFADIVLSAKYSPVTILSYKFVASNAFSIIDWDVLDEYSIKKPPFTIDVGKSRTIRLKYNSNNKFKKAQLFFIGDPCQCSIKLSGY